MSRPAPPHRRRRPRGKATLPDLMAVLQASVGDRLHAAGLAAETRIIQAGRPVDPSPATLRKAFPRARRRIAVWVHGLGVTESVWSFRGRRRTSYGAMLERDAGFTPVFLRYNTGRSIQENGAAADALLERLEASWPVRPSEIALIGYSMGGLVVRSALQQGIARSAPWVRAGPAHGAPWCSTSWRAARTGRARGPPCSGRCPTPGPGSSEGWPTSGAPE